MKFGPLNHRITLQRRPATKDAFGQLAGAWETVTTVWANVRPIGGRERVAARAVGGTLTHRISLLWDPALAGSVEMAGWRVLFGARVFNIEAAVNVNERDRWILLDATEGTLDGQ